ncbi:hypothetical protein D9M69_552420 [compost metagenome]
MRLCCSVSAPRRVERTASGSVDASSPMISSHSPCRPAILFAVFSFAVFDSTNQVSSKPMMRMVALARISMCSAIQPCGPRRMRSTAMPISFHSVTLS